MLKKLKKVVKRKNSNKAELKKILENKRLPIITLDSNWYAIKKIIKDKEIKSKEELLLMYLKQQGSLNNALKEIKQNKSILLDKILVLSNEVNTAVEEKKIKQLTLFKEEIEKINQSIMTKEQELLEVENHIKEINQQMFIEIIDQGYTFMGEHKPIIAELEKEIDELRVKMLDKIKEKKQHEETYKLYYQYLHNTVGYKNIQELDERIEGKEEKAERGKEKGKEEK